MEVNVGLDHDPPGLGRQEDRVEPGAGPDLDDDGRRAVAALDLAEQPPLAVGVEAVLRAVGVAEGPGEQARPEPTPDLRGRTRRWTVPFFTTPHSHGYRKDH
ncbi:hypothetical protein [Rubrivirga sp.]|uniref:hypothetical protein n=1 Tax=Rubrivirga sp. TaxID=1885344 RepID=UPI003B527EC0